MLYDSLGLDLEKLEPLLASKSAQDRVAWALETFGGRIILSSSFGAQSAVLLHMVTEQNPKIPVVVVDTGYLFPETYQFIEQLTKRLKLNLKTYRSPLTPKAQEEKFGKLWEKGVEGITQYNLINKVEPMNRALEELGAWAWIAGLRRQQSSSRKNLNFIRPQNGLLKIHPILDWTDKDVYEYLTKNSLPYHPLWEQGYVSIGDVHTTRKLEAGMSEEETRFFGLKRECGLHEA
ncbi:MAG: phosphoadenylyl-sulfate reductase [Verrucomicrobiota bacterium]